MKYARYAETSMTVGTAFVPHVERRSIDLNVWLATIIDFIPVIIGVLGLATMTRSYPIIGFISLAFLVQGKNQTLQTKTILASV